MKRGTNKKLAEFCQITQQHLSDILSRRKNPSAKLAVILEEFTSVPRTLWVWGSREDLREALESAFREPMQKDIVHETSEL
ncbi:MAG: helix-turn-helix domain-containing protein [Proteobacteria bacterium]|nr:helix-turn-helix domain-containing protein [Pseudomonadota bacterium]MBU1649861.1 helix-turn-helix domain-containing protein [Pseudomonadota bacterium]